MSLLYDKKLISKLKALDLRSEYAFFIGSVALIVSVIVSVKTFFKLVATGTNIFLALFISLIVFYVFTPVYSYLLFLGVTFFRKNEDRF